MLNILQQFINTAHLAVDFKTLTSGHINQTVEATVHFPNKAQKYILQRINTQIFPKPEDIMANIETVAKHLDNKNYPRSILKCLPLQDNSGFLYYENAEVNNSILETQNPKPKNAWRLVEHIENSFSYETVETTAQAYEAAYAFGEYARYLNDLDISKIKTIIPRFHDVDWRIEQFETALHTPSVLRLKNAQNDIDFIQKHIPFFKNKTLNIPQRITHNDTKISNILFDKTTQKAACIIDLDTLQPSTILSDFGDMVRAYTPNMGENNPNFKHLELRIDFFKAMTEGFLEGLKEAISPEEKSYLIYGGKRTVFVQALRFLTDYLNNDVYYKTYYEEQNLVRAQNQLALYKKFMKQKLSVK